MIDINKIKMYLASIVLFAGLITGTLLVLSPGVNAQASLACDGISGGTGSCDSGNEPQADSIVKTAINYLSIVAGIIAVIMLIIGGLKFITSGGDAGKVSSARNTVLYAIIGIIIAVIGQVFVQFVIGVFEPAAQTNPVGDTPPTQSGSR